MQHSRAPGHLTYRRTPAICTGFCTGFAPVSSAMAVLREAAPDGISAMAVLREAAPDGISAMAVLREAAPDGISAISLTFVSGRIECKRYICNKQSPVQRRHGPEFKAQSCRNTRLPFSNRQLSFCPTHSSCRIISEVTLGATYIRRDPSSENSEIFISNQFDPQFFFMYVYFYSLHVSGSHVPIIRRINCINEFHPNLHTKRSSIQSDIHQMSYCYN
jgi:hypothetical protein